MITLEQLLDSRDRRVQHQIELLRAFPGCSLICLTVQLPGPVKRSADSLLIGGAGLDALLNIFGSVLRHVQVRDLETGYEAYLLVPMPAVELKKRCCQIEDTHPLGRMMDIDVMAEILPQIPQSKDIRLVLVFDEQEVNENSSQLDLLNTSLNKLRELGYEIISKTCDYER